MTELRVRATVKVSAAPVVLGYVGEDANGSLWAWLTAEACSTEGDDRVELPAERLLPCAPGVPEDRLLALLAYWPAWRVTEWARLEIGCNVLIVGSSGLSTQVAGLCRCRGALWRAIWGAPETRDEGELWFPLPGEQRAEHVGGALPRPPDSVLVLGGSAHALTASLATCRDLGTVVVAAPPAAAIDLNLYPDVHRRGLTIHAGSPFAYGPGDVDAWNRAACRINTLIESGLLAP
jgi:NADPH:quinone reductase-like Zn-dependent oxidoreductase